MAKRKNFSDLQKSGATEAQESTNRRSFSSLTYSGEKITPAPQVEETQPAQGVYAKPTNSGYTPVADLNRATNGAGVSSTSGILEQAARDMAATLPEARTPRTTRTYWDGTTRERQDRGAMLRGAIGTRYDTEGSIASGVQRGLGTAAAAGAAAVDALSGLDYLNSNDRKRIENAQKNLETYTANRNAATNEVERQRWQKLADHAQNEIEAYTKGSEAKQQNAAGLADALRGSQERFFREASEGDYAARAGRALETVEKYGDNTYDDNLAGLSGSNYGVGRLSQNSSYAWNEYLNNPTPENRAIAELYDLALTNTGENNADALTPDNGLETWARSIANYAPQFLDQTAARLKGGAAGLALGSVSAGQAAGSALDMYAITRGAAFRGLLEAGVPEDQAMEMAKDEALISSIIEYADSITEYLTLGGKDIVKLLMSGGAELATTTAGKSAGRAAAKKIAAYLANIVQEGEEERSQEAVSIANERRLADGTTDSGGLGLARNALGVYWNEGLNGDRESESYRQMASAAAEGRRIASTFGAIQAGTGYAANRAENRLSAARGMVFISDAMEQAESGEVSNSAASKILNNEFARDLMQREGGLTLTDDMTKQEQRDAIKQAAAQLAGVSEAEPVVAPATNDRAGISEPSTTQRISESEAREVLPLRGVSEQQLDRDLADAARLSVTLGRSGANAFLTAYDRATAASVEPTAAFESFSKVYNAAVRGENAPEGSMPEHLRIAAQGAGESDARMAAQAQYFGENAGLAPNRSGRPRNLSRREARVLDAIGKAAGVQIKFADTMNGANASIENGVLTIAKDADDPVRAAFTHEIVHRVRESAPEAYATLAQFVVDNMSDERLASAIRARADAYSDMNYNISDITEEVVADAFGRMASEPELLEKIAGVDRTAAQKILDAIDELLRKIKAALSGKKQEQLTANQIEAFRDLQGRGEEMAKALRTALDKVQEQAQTAAIELSGVANASDAKEAEASEIKYSRVIDEETLDWLNKQKTVKAYRAMQVIDGKLYPPMAAKVASEGTSKRQLVEPTELNAWYRSDERPDLVDPKTGKFKLDKANGATIEAAYNPYFHTSATPLNDQFSSAYKRPNLVTVEVEIPESELTSGYKAQYAKDSVGETKWHAGPVASQLKGEKARRVFLSRWAKVNRIVPDAEVAQIVARTLEGENIAVPYKVVTPSLRAELGKAGVTIDTKGEKKAATEDGAARYSRNVDSEYMAAVERGDMDEAERIVRETANKAGYTVEAYHGTMQFGFTRIDTGKSDDKISFFATNDPLTAQTYSASDGVREVHEKGYTVSEKEDAEDKAINALRSEASSLTRTLSSVAGVHGFIDVDDLADHMLDIVDSGVNNNEQREVVEDQLFEYLQGLASDVFEYTHRDVDPLDNDYEYQEWVESKEGQRVQTALDDAQEKALAYLDARNLPAARGNYHLFINPEGMLEVEGNGANWNKIPFMPDELKQIKARMDEIERAHVRGTGPMTDNPEWLDLSNRFDERAEEILNKYYINPRAYSSTREIARYAVDNGYTGVRFKDIVDDGGQGMRRVYKPSDVYIMFNPQAQAKSADLVTYADDGTIIPLSERFNTQNSDIRYSRNVDSEGRELTEAQAEYFENSKVRDEKENLKPVYHGTGRADRVGTVFLPERATSGPMAFFTDNPEIAENYSKDKRDTSMAYDEDYDSYETQFRIKAGNRDIPLIKAWGYLPFDARRRITEAAGHVREDWDGESGEDFIFDPDTNEANGGFQYHLKEGRGNALWALNEQWLNGGILFNEEAKYLDVLRKVGVFDEFAKVKGMGEPFYKDPNYREEKVYEAYLDIQLPFDTANVTGEFVKGFEEWYDEQDASKYERESMNADMWDKNSVTAEDFAERLRNDMKNGTTHAWTSIPDSMTDYLKYLGHDGIFDKGGKNGGVSHTVYIPFYSWQIKNTDNLAPTMDKDIRFSRKSVADAEAREAALLQENDLLREEIKYWKAQLERTPEENVGIVDPNAVRKTAKKLIVDYGSTLAHGEITNELQDLYNLMGTGSDKRGELSYESAREIADSVARKIAENAVDDTESAYRMYEDLRSFLRTMDLTVTAAETAEIADWGDWRKQNFGRMQVKRGETSNIERIYDELSDAWPEFFPGDVLTVGDQLNRIAAVVDYLYRDLGHNPYDPYMDQAVIDIGNDIMERFFDLPQAKTFADKQAAKIETLRVQMSELRARDSERLQKSLAKVRESRDKQIERMTERFRAKTEAGRERQSAAKLRKQIMRHTSALSQKLLRPTDKQHIPDSLRAPVAAMLEAINKESAYDIVTDENGRNKRVPRGEGDVLTKRTQAFAELKKQYTELKDDENLVIDPDLLGDETAGFQGLFDQVLAMSATPIQRMSTEQLQTVWKVVRAVEHSVSTYGKTLSAAKFKTTADWAFWFRSDASYRKDRATVGGKDISLGLENPYTFFSQYGESGKAIFRMLRDAQDTQRRRMDRIAEAVHGIAGSKTVKELRETRHEFTTERGDTLTLTTAQIMELYNLTKREQAQNHLLKGGIVQPEIPAAGKQKRIERGTDMIRLTQTDLGELAALLTPEQMEIADALQQLTATTLAEWGNEASMAAYGYRKFTEQNYWPIHTAQEALHSKVENDRSNPRSIKNIGMAKALVPNASNAVSVGDVFTTFAEHAADMIDYSSWLLPMEDANRLFNFKYKGDDGYPASTFKQELDRVGGRNGKAQKYWTDLMADIQNGLDRTSRSDLEGLAARGIGNVKGASVGANLRVIVQQPTAYLRANAVMNPESLTKGLIGSVTRGNGWQKAQQYAAIARIKDVGGFDQGSTRSVSNELYSDRTALEKVGDIAGRPASKADAVTWGALWNAAEWETKRLHPDIAEGSAAFYQKAAEIFTDTIDQTQVVDGVLQRSAIMRSGDRLTQQMTAFMGEPLMALNLMLRSYDNVRYAKTKEQRGAAIRQLGRAVVTLAVTDIVNSAVQSLVDALRKDDKDKDYWERFMTALTGLEGDEKTLGERLKNIYLEGNFADNASLIGKVPLLKDLRSILQGFTVERLDAGAISDLMQSAQQLASGKYAPVYGAYRVAEQAAKIIGIPATNLERDAHGIVRSVFYAIGDPKLLYEYEKAIFNARSTKNKSRFFDTAYMALEQGDTATYETIRNDLVDKMGVSAKDVDDNMKSRYSKAVKEDGAYTLPQASADLLALRQKYSVKTETEEKNFKAEDLGATAYTRYSNQRARDYKTYKDALEKTKEFRKLSAEDKDRALNWAYSLADEMALEENSDGQYKMTDKWKTYAKDAKRYGISMTNYLTFHMVAETTSSTRDKNGKEVKDQKKADKLRDWLENRRGLTDGQRAWLWGTIYSSEW